MTQELEMLLDEFDAAVSFWNTEEGLLERIGLLGDQIQFGTYNHALKVIATSVGATDFRIAGPPGKCPWCAMHVGMVYHRCQFTPELPKHPNCPHYFEVERTGAEPKEPDSEFAAFWGLVS